MINIGVINSTLNVSLAFKFWTANLTALRESLARKGFALASAGLVQQGGIVATIEAGPLAYKGSSTLLHEPDRRRLVLAISNSKNPNENLTEILSSLDMAGIPSRDLIERIDIAGQVLLNSSIQPMATIQKATSKTVIEDMKQLFKRDDVLPVGIRFATMNTAGEIFQKPSFNMLIEPLFSDMSKYLAHVNYSSNDVEEAIAFLANLFISISEAIKILGKTEGK